MRKFERSVIPSFLTNKYQNSTKTVQKDRTERWTTKVARFNANKIKSASYDWYELDVSLKQDLLKLTKRHCAFCDKIFRADDSFEIEHFKPKMDYPTLAFEWTNLYPICPKCNLRKGKKYHDNLLKPDLITYKYTNYFEFENTNKYKLSSKNNRGEKTIELYQLNRPELLKAREEEIKMIEDILSDKIVVNNRRTVEFFFNSKSQASRKVFVSQFINEKINKFSYRNLIEYYFSIN